MSTMKFIAWQDLDGNEIANAAYPPGLVFIKSQEVGTAVSSVTVTDAFSSTFDNYKIVYHGGSGSGFGSLLMTLGSTTTDYYWGRYYVYYSGGSINSSGGSADSSWSVGTIQDNPNLTMVSVDLFGPYLSVSTMMQLNVRLSGLSGAAGGGGGFLNSTTSYTSFTLTASANTMTGGTIRVYGYNNG